MKLRVSKRCVELTGIFTGKAHLDSHFINKPSNQRGGRLSAYPSQRLCPLHLLIPGSAWSDDSHCHLLCLPRSSRGDGMIPWIPSALGLPTQQVWGARSLNSGWGMRICTSLLSRVGFSVGSRESEGPFPGILIPTWDLRIPPSLTPCPLPQAPRSCGWSRRTLGNHTFVPCRSFLLLVEADHHQLLLGRFSEGRAGEQAYSRALEQAKKSREAGFFPRAAMASMDDPGQLLPLLRICFLIGKNGSDETGWCRSEQVRLWRQSILSLKSSSVVY